MAQVRLGDLVNYGCAWMAILMGYGTIARDLLDVCLCTGLSTTGRVYLTEHC